MAKHWMGTKPEKCQCNPYCTKPVNQQFVDGRDPTTGMWGCFSVTCFKKLGGTFGLGRGQRYDAVTLEKVEG